MAEQQKAFGNHIFQWDGGGREVYLAGDFNNWERVPVSTPNGSGGVLVDLKLPVGNHSYMFIVDGEWKNDPSNILPLTNQGRSQVTIFDSFQLDDENFSMTYDFDTDESDSDTESVSSVSSHPSATNAPRGEAVSKLHFKFPQQAKDYVKEHIVNFGYGNSMINYHAQTNNKSAIVIMTASVGNEVVKNLNGSMIQGQYQLTVQPHVKKTRSRARKKSQNTESSTPGVTTSNPTKTKSVSKSEPCRVFFGSKLPEYTNEQHIREHFVKFEKRILKIELIRDKRTNQFKGFGFITFSSSASAKAAIQALDQSILLGIRVRVSLEKSKQVPSISQSSVLPGPVLPPYVPPPSGHVNAPSQGDSESLSDVESVTSDISTSSDKIKVLVHSRPKFSKAVSNRKFRQHFKEFESGISNAFIAKNSKTRQSLGFGIIFFSSLEMANLAIQKMRNTKVMGEFQIISIGFGKGELQSPSGPSLVDRTEFNDGASIASGRSGFQPTYSGPVHSQPPADCVIIENIDPSFSESEIRALISAPMLSFNRLPPPSNGVMIKLYPNTDAHAIAQSLNGKNVMDRCIHAYVPRTNPAPPSNVGATHQPPRALAAGPPPAFAQCQPPATGPLPTFGPGQPSRHALATGPPPAFGSGQPGTSHAYGGGAQMPSTHPNLGMPSSPNQKQLQRAYSNPPFSPTAPVPPTMHPPTMNRTMSTEPATHQADFQPPIARVPSLDPQQTSVKVTHLPPTITKEKLYLHFRKAGEIKGEPVIHVTSKSVFAHVNFYQPMSAQNAAFMLDNSIIDGTTIRVKLARTKSPNVETKSIERDNYEKVLKLDPNQWNTLMLVNPNSGISLFQDAISPYKSNPNVIIQLVHENQSVKFSGKFDAVEDAYSTLKRQLNKKLPVDRLKREALVNLRPSLPSEINQKYGAHIVDYQGIGPTIQFEGPITGIERAHGEVKALVDSLFSKEEILEKEYQVDQLEKARKQIKVPVYICCPDLSRRKSVVLFSFDHTTLQNSAPRVVQLLSVNAFRLECKPEQAVYLRYFKKDFISKLPAKATFDSSGEKVTLNGGESEIRSSKEIIRAQVFEGLCSEKFSYSCNPKFQSQIEETILRPLLDDPTFQYITPKLSGQTGREKGRRKNSHQAKDEVITVYVYCRNPEFFEKVCQSLRILNPGSKYYRLPHENAASMISENKIRLENKYKVRIMQDRASSVTIHGLTQEEVQQCYDEIKELIESNLMVVKYVSVNPQVCELLKLYQTELAELRRDCSELTVLPPNKDNVNGVIRIKGSISQVDDVKERLSSGLLSMNLSVEQFDLSCPSGLFGMWCKRWNQVKQQEERRLKVLLTFSKSGQGSGDNKLNVKFTVIGTDEIGVQEVKDAILTEGVQAEEKIIELSSNGANCLLKAKKDKKLDFLNNVIVNVGHVDKSTNKVTVFAPKELGENLSIAEEQIRKFVGDRASTSHVICSKDPVVGLILLSPVRSVHHITNANAIAGQHRASVHVLKKPSVGLRISGSETAIAKVKPLIQTTVIEAIEKTIGEKKVPIKALHVPLLTSTEFTRFQSKLESDLCVTCSYPKSGKVTKLICSSLIRLDSAGYVKIDICKGDLIHEQVDAIVNAANEDLKHIGGLAKAISDAGGPSIQTESDDYIRTNRKVKPGQAVGLGAGDLPCKKVIHAVGPRWMGGHCNEEQTLYFSVFKSLEAASNESLSSIAFPAIGTGVFNVPEDICARASLKAVRDFCQAFPYTSISTVKFILFQQSSVNVFKPLIVSGQCGEYQYGNQSVLRPPQPRRACVPESNPASKLTRNWQWLNDQGTFTSYSSEISNRLTAAFQSIPKGSIQVIINGVPYVIDVAKMTQTNSLTGHSRSITQIFDSSDFQWMYQDDTSACVYYKPNDSKSIETMFLSKTPGQLTINGKMYTFDFTQMCQINIATGFKRKIFRRTRNDPKIETLLESPGNEGKHEDDEEDEPKLSNDIILTLRGPYESLGAAEYKLMSKLTSATSSQVLDTLPKNMTPALKKKLQQIAKKNSLVYSFEEKSKKGKKYKVLKVEGVRFKVQAAVHAINEEILTFHVTSVASEDDLQFPSEWVQQTQTTELFQVTHGSPEWQQVEGKFAATMAGHPIHSIARIQNKWLWEKYAIQKKRLDRKNQGRVNEMELFHGTRSNDPKLIYEGEDGFDMRYGAQGMWGVANYFAVNASYSNNYVHQSQMGRKEMFLVKVLTGDSHECPSNRSLRMPPAKPTTGGAQGGDVQFSQMKYDTVTGHTNGSQVFMTYDNDKAYPAYLISY